MTRISYTFFEKDPSTAKVWMSIFSFLYGLLLIFPPEGLQSYGWEVLRHAGPLWVYGFFFICQSSISFYSTIMEETNKWILLTEGALGTLMWTTIALVHSFALARLDPTLVGALLSFWLTTRIRFEKGTT